MADRSRADWLREVARRAVERMDRRWAPVYDDHWAEISPSHAEMLNRLLARLPLQPRILDAACGTGKYWSMLLQRGADLVGIDRSGGMLARASAKYPEVPTRRQALAELDEVGAYDGIACIDAMENVPPEDWPVILAAFARALRPGGSLYLTVELPDRAELAREQAAALAEDWPVLPGEQAVADGYHFYPEPQQVRDWLVGAGFALEDEAIGDEYLHLIARARSG